MKLLVLLLLMACSAPKKEDPFWEKHLDFVAKQSSGQKLARTKGLPLVNASSKYKQKWISNPTSWVKKHEEDYSEFRYFAYTTDPLVNLKQCRDYASANAKAMIWGVVPGKMKGKVHGAQIYKNYWKTIRLKQNRRKVHICSALIKIHVDAIKALR